MVDAEEDERMNGKNRVDARTSVHDFAHILPEVVVPPGNNSQERWADSEPKLSLKDALDRIIFRIYHRLEDSTSMTESNYYAQPQLR